MNFPNQQLSDNPQQSMLPVFPQDRPDVLPSDYVPSQPTMKAPPTMSMAPIDMLIDTEIVDMMNNREEISKQARRMRRLIWDKCWQHMKGVYDTTNKKAWQSKTHMPLTSKVVEVVTSNMHQALLGPDSPVEWQTRRSDYDGVVRSINEIQQTDFEKCNAKAELTDFLRNMCVMGTAIGEVGYLKQTETVMVKQRLPKEVSDMFASMGVKNNDPFVPKTMLVKDYATIKNVDIYDIYPEPRKPEFSKDAWVIVKSKITNRELVMGARDEDPYYRFDNVTDDLLEGSGTGRLDIDPEKQTRRYALLDYNVYAHFLDPDREHELSTFYGQIPLWYLQPELRKDRRRQYDSVPGCIKVVDGQWVVWKRISPWRDGEPPFFKGNYIKIPGPEGFYGIGVAELVLGLQIEKNEIRNSRMDNINLSLNKIFAVLKDMVPAGEWKRLVSEPGALWLFRGVDDVRKAIQEVQFGNVTQDSWEASQEVDHEAEEVTAANKVTQAVGGGESDAGGSTFRGQMLNVQQATGRWMLYARMMEWTGLMPAMKKFYQRIYQFKDMSSIADVLGPERMQQFQLLAPEELEKVAKLVPMGVMTMENKGVRLAQMNQFATLWMQFPFFKKLEFARKMLVEQGNPEPDAFLFSDEEMAQFNQAQRMMIGSAMQPPSMGGQPPQNGLLGPNGQPMNSGPQTGNRANVPQGTSVSGNVPGPLYGMPRPAMPARGPGASPFDMAGRPMS